MLLADMNRKLWTAYEKAERLHSGHLLLYNVKLVWLMLQSAVVIFLLFLIYVILIKTALANPGKSLDILAFIGITLLISASGFISEMFNRPWKGMIKLDRKKFPNIYRKVNFVARRVNAPYVHEIYLYDEFNMQVSLGGIPLPGLRRHVLMIGYPMLFALSSRAFLSCLAHEMGHFSHRHIYYRIFTFAIGSFWRTLHLGIYYYPLIPWLKYYLPSVETTLLPLYRQHELEADRFSAAALGNDSAAALNIQMELKGAAFAKLMDRIFKEKATADDWDKWGNLDVAQLIYDEMQLEMPLAEANKILDKAMARKNPIYEEHPTFRERLELTGVKDIIPFVHEKPNAFAKLFKNRDEIFAAINHTFHNPETDLSIAEYRKNFQAEENFLAKVDLHTDIAVEDLPRILDALQTTGRESERKELVQRLYTMHPDDPAIRCYMGSELIDSDPETAIKLITGSITISPILAVVANDALLSYYIHHGMNEEIKKFFDLRDGKVQKIRTKLKCKLKDGNMIRSCQLNDYEREQLIELISTNSQIKKAYAIQCRVEENAAVEARIIVIQPDRHFCFKLESSITEQIIIWNKMDPIFDYVAKEREFCEKYLDVLPDAQFYEYFRNKS